MPRPVPRQHAIALQKTHFSNDRFWRNADVGLRFIVRLLQGTDSTSKLRALSGARSHAMLSKDFANQAYKIVQ